MGQKAESINRLDWKDYKKRKTDLSELVKEGLLQKRVVSQTDIIKKQSWCASTRSFGTAEFPVAFIDELCVLASTVTKDGNGAVVKGDKAGMTQYLNDLLDDKKVWLGQMGWLAVWAYVPPHVVENVISLYWAST